jgi:tetratricopeptide (TPR) repeat protein
MLNIIDLEKKWLQYKVKSYIPHLSIAISLIIIAVLASIILNSQESAKEEVATKKIILNKPVVKVASIVTPKEPIVKEKIVLKVKKSTSTKLQPSLSFMRDMQNSSLPYYSTNNYRESRPDLINKTPAKKEKKKIVSKTVTIEEPVTEKKEIIQKKPTIVKTERIIITKKETKDDISNVIKRFKVNNNPALSLFIAKKYYEIGNYHQSYNYALITNQINKDIESSWIIFAKSLAKLNKRDKAISTLKEYIKVSDSYNARLLLQEIQSGNFK